MRTVRNKKELEAAIKARETEVLVEGFGFKLACQAAAKYQKYRLKKSVKYKPYGAVNIPATPIFIAIIASITVLAIIAMCKKYNVEIDYLNGKIIITYNERNNK